MVIYNQFHTLGYATQMPLKKGEYIVLAAVLDLTTLFRVIPKILKLGPHKNSLLVYDEAWTAM